MNPRVRDVRFAIAAQWLRDQAASGLSKKEWCNQNGISRGRFFYYQRRLQNKVLDKNPEIEQAAANALTPTFVEVSTPACINSSLGPQHERCPEHPSAGGEIQITYGGFRICTSGEVAEQELTMVLRAVKHAD